MRAGLLDWTAPWATYRTEVEEPIDCGERVVVSAPSFGCLPGSEKEIRLDGANVWTVTERTIARIYHSTKADAFKLVGVRSVQELPRWRIMSA
jgi:hypothetical protein